MRGICAATSHSVVTGMGALLNFQNWPRDDKTCKKAIYPKLDLFLAFDYSAIEYRILAYYLTFVGSPEMADDFKQGLDPHEQAARLVLGHCNDDTERQVGKTLNFLMVYGGGVKKLMTMLADKGYPLEYPEARKLWDAYHEARPGMRKLTNPPNFRGQQLGAPGALELTMQQRGYVKTIAGRHLRPESGHKVLNAICQGSAAELMRMAMVKVHRWQAENPELESHPVLSVHDDLLFDVRESELQYLASSIPNLMTHEPIEQVVPIVVDLEVSRASWADKEKLI